jgi:D-alanyl-D-alanine carboxypeptidase
MLARALIHDFPEYDSYWHIPAIKFGGRVVRNYNTLLGRYPGADGMKTGFICASGFNLVATATRNGKRLIAVVFGAPSGGARAVKAAELLESGFTQNPLSWLTPALGSVDALTPIQAAPPNLHDEVCGRHRKKPAAEDEDVDAGDEGNSENGVKFSALLSSLRAPTPKGAALLSEDGAVTPVVVYIGPTRSPADVARLATIEPPAAHKKKGGAKTGTKATAKPAKHAAKHSGDDATDGKPAAGGSSDAKPWSPLSSSTLASSPPSELQTKKPQ